ncbi:MAG TPA: hypothetical protein PK129_10625 [Cellvibrionaceae bacterium]|nr:hypothetical protein [Cellvibrionaceae bacterium]
MRLLARHELSIRLLWAADDQQLATSQLVLGGQELAVAVTGAVLEACIEVGDNYLLFLTDDISSEDSLNIYHFDSHFTLHESLSIGAAYCTGAFVLGELIAPAQVVFHFLGEGAWHLTLLPEPSTHVPFFSDPAGVRRPFCLRTRMKLQFFAGG